MAPAGPRLFFWAGPHPFQPGENRETTLSRAERHARRAAADRARQAQDFATALALYRELAAAGDGESWQRLGDGHRDGDLGLEKDWAAARDCYERAVARGWVFAYAALGDLHRRGGPGLAADWARARDWYERALAAGDLFSHRRLNQLYTDGGPNLAANRRAAHRYDEEFTRKILGGHRHQADLFEADESGLDPHHQPFFLWKDWYRSQGSFRDED